MALSREFTLRFCRRWVDKANQCNCTGLDGAFDRFFSLIVAFNRLYSYVSLSSRNSSGRDQHEATVVFPREVGSGRLLAALIEDEGSKDLRVLARLIAPGGQFYLHSDRRTGRRDEASDQQLHDDLGSSDNTTKVKAVLKFLYLVRCNMFHGRKDFDDKQLQIIEPATRCLMRVVHAGIDFVEQGDS